MRMQSLTLFALFVLLIPAGVITVITPTQYRDLTNRWVTASSTFDRLIWPHGEVFASLIGELQEREYVSAACKMSLLAIKDGLTGDKKQLWALKFLDSTGRGRSGMAYGYTSDVGNMDECITNDVMISGDHRINGKYCLMSLNFPLLNKSDVGNLHGVNFSLAGSPLQDSVYELYSQFVEMMMYTPAGFKFGVCIPSTCDSDHVELFINEKLRGSELTVKFSTTCETIDTPVAAHHLLAIMICTCYIAFVITATVLTRDSEQQSSLLEHFNFMLNTNKLFVETKDPLAQQISFFHGIRFYYQLAAIVAHSIDIYPFLPTAFAVMYIRVWPIWIFKQMYKSIGFVVQLPFSISGFLTYVTMLPYVRSRGGNVSFWDYVFKRWLRTTPTMLGVMLFGFAWSGMGRGPVHRETQEMTIEKCRKYWWTNLLYISNWWHFEDMCLFHTWTYSSDFQCFMLSYITIYFMVRDKRKGLQTVIAFIVAGCFASGLVTYLMDMSPYPNFYALDARQYDLCTWFYFHTYHSVPAYFAGILCAYFFLEGMKMDQKYVWPGWVLSAFLSASTGLVPYYVDFNGESTRAIEILHAALHRLFFVTFFVYSAYLSCFGMGGFIQWLYEIKLWVPFGRMSASVFMAHYSFIWFDLGNSMDYVSTRGWNLTMTCSYMVLFSLLYSYGIYLLFEAPSMSMMKTKLKASQRPVQIEQQISRTDQYSLVYKEIQEKLEAAQNEKKSS